MCSKCAHTSKSGKCDYVATSCVICEAWAELTENNNGQYDALFCCLGGHCCIKVQAYA